MVFAIVALGTMVVYRQKLGVYMEKKKKVLYTAIKPTGVLTLGGYIGVGQTLQEICEEYESYICVADLHALTINPDPHYIQERTYKIIAFYLALGLDPDKTTLYVQSQVDEHSKMAWILSNFTMYGEATRMTQFKDYQAKSKEINVGLFAYPILMAGDILLYDTEVVPVGIDQKQHVELARDIANRFNSKIGQTFVVPDVMLRENGMKICGLLDPSKKMSKSDADDKGSIMLEDTAQDIRNKLKRAVTDSDNKVAYDPVKKPGVSNLLTIYATLKGLDIEQTVKHFEIANYGTLKTQVADAIIEALIPVQTKYYEYLSNREYLQKVMKQGQEKASAKAREKIKEVYQKLGLVMLD